MGCYPKKRRCGICGWREIRSPKQNGSGLCSACSNAVSDMEKRYPHLAREELISLVRREKLYLPLRVREVAAYGCKA